MGRRILGCWQCVCESLQAALKTCPRLVWPVLSERRRHGEQTREEAAGLGLTAKSAISIDYLDPRCVNYRDRSHEVGRAYVSVLVRRRSARSAGQTIGLLDQVLARSRAKVPRGETEEALINDLTIERELAAKSWRDEKGRYDAEKERAGGLLDLSAQETQALELRGTIHDPGPRLPPLDALVAIALGQRPDLAAYRLGTSRAQAVLIREWAERFPDAYFLYTPFEYRDNSQMGQKSASSWGAGLLVWAPLFNRDQGNRKRARLNIDQSQIEAVAMEKRVIAEVRQAAREFEDSYEDALRWKEVVLPAVRRKSD